MQSMSWILFLCLMVAVACSSSVIYEGPHLFVDLQGLTEASNLTLRQHEPIQSNEWLIIADQPWENYLLYYNSIVQVSEDDLRIYYDAFGPHGRFLCVATSSDRGHTWKKPELNIVPFNGSTANNIVLGSQTDSDGETIEPGVVFLDSNPDSLPSQRFKAVMRWYGRLGATMFSSQDGFQFTPMTASASLYGSDTQDVVFYDHRRSAYVYYGRSHQAGKQPISCAQFSGDPDAQRSARSINHFVIGSNVTHWPTNNSDSPDNTIFNTDEQDPPCMDIYTNSAMALHDAYFFFPLMYDHFTEPEAQGRGNDGLLEPRMLVSRDGHNLESTSLGRAGCPGGLGRQDPIKQESLKGL